MNNRDALRVVHVNICKSREGLESVFQYVCSSNIDICCVQEAPILPSIPGYAYRNWGNYQAVHTKYTSIYVRSVLPVLAVCQEEMVTIIKVGGHFFVNMYFHEDVPPNDLFEKIPNEVWNSGKWVMMGDVNASHPMWDFETREGYVPNPHKLERGESIMECIEKWNGHCCNEYTSYGTFINRNAETYIDATFAGKDAGVWNWNLQEDLVAYDHRLISFSVGEIARKHRTSTNWKRYDRLQSLWIRHLGNQFEEAKGQQGKLPILVHQKITACAEAAQVKATVVKSGKIWWNNEINRMLKAVCLAQNRWRKDRNNPSKLQAMKDMRKAFKHLCRKTRRAFHRKNLAKATWGVQGKGEFKNLMRMLKGNMHMAVQHTLKDNTGNLIPIEETPKVLLHNAFIAENAPPLYGEENIQPIIKMEIFGLHKQTATAVQLEELEAAVSATKKRTAAGIDALGLGHFEHMHIRWKNWLLCAYNEILATGRIPRSWLHAKVIFLPKGGKDPTTISGWRPISMLPLIMRLLDRIVTRRVTRELMVNKVLHDDQHGFRQNHSTTSLLRDLIIRIENVKRNGKMYGILAVDFRKAFDNISHTTIAKGILRLMRKGIITEYGKYICSYLQDRKVTTVYGGMKGDYHTNRGIPQGGCLSPALYNIGILDLICTLQELKGCQAHVFADDLTILVEGKTTEMLKDRILEVFEALRSHEDAESFIINFEKTKLLVGQSQKMKWDQFAEAQNNRLFLAVQQWKVEIVQSMKLLGVHFTTDGKFNRHFNVVGAIVRSKFQQLKRFYGISWGLDTKFLRTATGMLLFSHFRYAVGATWTNVHQGTRKLVTKIQADVARSILKLTRIAPSIPSIIFAFHYRLVDVLDMDFLLFGECTHKKWWWNKGGTLKDGKYLQKIAALKATFKYPFQAGEVQCPEWQFKHPELYQRIRFDGITDKDQALRRRTVENHNWTIYTDASRHIRQRTVGGGMLLRKNGVEIESMAVSFRCSLNIFQAESATIALALGKVGKDQVVHLYSDSLSALYALRSGRTHDPYIQEIWKLTLERNLRLFTYWVPGHKGNPYNETVDRLAAIGSSPNRDSPDYLSRNALKTWLLQTIRNNRRDMWQEEYWKKKSFHTLFVNTNRVISDCSKKWYKQPELVRMVLGVGQLRQNLFFLRKVANPYCPHCEGEQVENAAHLLFDCNHFKKDREALWNKIGNPMYHRRVDIQRWMLKDHTRVLALINFLKATEKFGAYHQNAQASSGR